MRSVADHLRLERLQRAGRLSVEERIRLALDLGRRGLRTFASAQGLDETEARRQLLEQRQRGRRASACARGTAC